MDKFRYVTRPWLWANIIHPFAFLAGYGFLQNEFIGQFFFPILLCGFVFSVPAYVFCLICIRCVQLIRTNTFLRFCFWLALLLFCISTSAVLISIAVDCSKNGVTDWFVLSLPGTLSALLSTLSRYTQFKNLFQRGYENRIDHQQ